MSTLPDVWRVDQTWEQLCLNFISFSRIYLFLFINTCWIHILGFLKVMPIVFYWVTYMDVSECYTLVSYAYERGNYHTLFWLITVWYKYGEWFQGNFLRCKVSILLYGCVKFGYMVIKLRFFWFWQYFCVKVSEYESPSLGKDGVQIRIDFGVLYPELFGLLDLRELT